MPDPDQHDWEDEGLDSDEQEPSREDEIDDRIDGEAEEPVVFASVL